MKKSFLKIVLLMLFMGTAVVASSSEYGVDTYSLVGVEGGYSSFEHERTAVNGDIKRTKSDLVYGGIKVGAQSKHYRIFFSAHFFDTDDFNYARMYGVGGQYMFNFSKFANFFVGVNAGTTDMEFIDNINNKSIKVYEPYYGGDLGFNIHLSNSIDWEIGAKYITINSDQKENNIEYNFNNITTGYTSVIFKFKMD